MPLSCKSTPANITLYQHRYCDNFTTISINRYYPPSPISWHLVDTITTVHMTVLFKCCMKLPACLAVCARLSCLDCRGVQTVRDRSIVYTGPTLHKTWILGHMGSLLRRILFTGNISCTKRSTKISMKLRMKRSTKRSTKLSMKIRMKRSMHISTKITTKDMKKSMKRST